MTSLGSLIHTARGGPDTPILTHSQQSTSRGTTPAVTSSHAAQIGIPRGGPAGIPLVHQLTSRSTTPAGTSLQAAAQTGVPRGGAHAGSLLVHQPSIACHILPPASSFHAPARRRQGAGLQLSFSAGAYGVEANASLNAPGKRMPAKRPFVPRRSKAQHEGNTAGKGAAANNLPSIDIAAVQGPGGFPDVATSAGSPTASTSPAAGAVLVNGSAASATALVAEAGGAAVRGGNGAAAVGVAAVPAGHTNSASNGAVNGSLNVALNGALSRASNGASNGAVVSNRAVALNGAVSLNGAAVLLGVGQRDVAVSYAAMVPSSETAQGEDEEEEYEDAEESEEDNDDDEEEQELVVNPMNVLQALQNGGGGPNGSGSSGAEGVPNSTPGLTLGSLITMIKDAEQNILLLNRVRGKALAELSQARLENTNLQNQLRIFQARIAESDARLSMVAQARQRSSLLEEQLHSLQERLDETQEVSDDVEGLRRQLGQLQRKAVEGEMAGAQLAVVGREKERLEVELQAVREQLVLLGLEKGESEKRWKEQVDATRARMDELQVFLHEAEVQVRELGDAVEVNKKLSAEVEQLKAQLVQKEEAVVRVEKEVEERARKAEEDAERAQRDAEEAQARLESLESAVGRLSEEVELVQGKLGEATRELEGASEALKGREEEGERLRREMEAVEGELGEKRAALAAAQREQEEARERVRELSGRLETVEGEAEIGIKDATERARAVEGALEAVEEEVKEVKERLGVKEGEVERLTASLADLHGDKERLQADVRRLARVAEDKTAAKAQADTAREELSRRLREAQLELEKAQLEAKQAAEAAVAREKRISEGKLEAEALERRAKAAEGAVEEMQGDILALREMVRGKEEEVERLAGVLSEKGEVEEGLVREVEGLKAEVGKREREVGEKQKEIGEVQSQLRAVKKALEIAVREADASEESAKAERERLLVQQREMRDRVVKLEGEVAEGRRAQEELKLALKGVQEELREKEGEVEKARAALAAEEEEGAGVRGQVAKLKGELQEKEVGLGVALREKEELLGDMRALKAKQEGTEGEAEAAREEVEEEKRRVVEALQRSTAELNAKLKEADAKALELQGALEEAKKELGAKGMELGVAQGALKGTEERGRQLLMELEAAKSRVGVEGWALEEARKEGERLSAQVRELKAVLKEVREEGERVREEGERVRAEAVEAAEREKKELLERLEKSERATRKQREEVDAALRQLRAKEREVQMVQEALGAQKGEGGDLKAQVGALGMQAAELQAALAEARKEKAMLEASVKSLKEAQVVQEREADAAKKETESEKKRAIEGLHLELLTLRQQAAEKEAELESSKMEAIQSAVAEGERKLMEVSGRLGREQEGLAVQILEMRRKAEKEKGEMEKEKAEMEKREGELRAENERLKSQVEGLEGRAEKLEAVVQGAGEVEKELKRLQTLVGEGENLKAAAEAVVSENKLLQAEVQRLKDVLSRIDQEVAKRIQPIVEEQERTRAQVEVLKAELLSTDELMKTQLEAYQEELLFLQQRGGRGEYDGMVLPGLEGREQVAIGAVHWDLWSNLLLKVDELLLTKLLDVTEASQLRQLVWHRDVELCRAWQDWESQKLTNKQLAAGLKGFAGDQQAGRQILHVVHIAAEMAPVAKVGGLGDVVTGLCRSLQQRGHLVEVILPKYDCMDYSRIDKLTMIDMDFKSYFEGQLHSNRIWRGLVEGLPVHFIEPHHPGRFFWRGEFYGCQDDFMRFTYFCRAALDFLLLSKKKPDIIHCHDWQTAAVAPLYWDVFVPLGLNSAQVAMTCHNFEYQGIEHSSALAACGLDVGRMKTPERMQDNFIHDRVNLLKGGIVYANMITTVSPTYATEVRGAEGGRGLHLTLAQHSAKFFGVLNGIDTEVWNPLTDELIHAPFTSDNHTEGKRLNKEKLRSRLRLSNTGQDENKPLVGCITRLVPQKGVHLIRHAIFRAKERGGQFVLLGNSPVPEIQRDFENLARQLEHDPNVRLVLKYDEGLSHLIFAGSDMLIIPSLFEPCGLTQLIAMRYGSIPIVRKTGGLADSVFDVDDPSLPLEKKNGYAFTATDTQGLNYAMDRAFGSYYERPQWWSELVERAMLMDFSWAESCSHYVSLYQKTLASKNL